MRIKIPSRIGVDYEGDFVIPTLKKTKNFGKLHCLVQPRASSFRWRILEDNIEIWIPAVPEKGKANRFLLKQLSQLLDVNTSSLSIEKGHKTREKIIQVNGISQEELNQRLRTLESNPSK